MNKTYVFEYKNVKVEHTLDNAQRLESFTLYVNGELKKRVVNRETEAHYIAPQRLVNVVQEELGLKPSEKFYPIGLGELIKDNSYEIKQALHYIDKIYDSMLNNPREVQHYNFKDLELITVL